ncbi:glycosyltransferase family 4 protein [Sulfurimonas microaerophilic]|uniref:glycosyltransferase family 4 protein n=1 Tax=Sulfurimonas microaerophilic TaxID=3058392 RepID=UPI002714FE53|nr:glycosyltransferase family 4 protein [Sulfurimonas sp. hsl 1-7]
MKNILELCLADGLGGLEMFVATCYEDFSKKNTCKLVVSPDSKLDNYFDNEDKFHIKRNKFFPIFPALKLAKYIDQNEIDIVHFHWTKDILTAVLAKLLSKRKTKLVQSRHMRMTRFKDDFYHKWLYRNIDMMHAVTLEVKTELEKFIPEGIRPKIEMIYLGTDIPEVDEQKVQQLRAKYALQDKFVVGIIGRIEEPKGQWMVLEVIEKLKELDIVVLIVGSAMDEQYLAKLKQYIIEADIEDKVIFSGFTKDVAEHLKLFDVNILATEHETFGLVVIEAMANKIPVIATKKGGPLEIITDGEDGLLFNRTVDDLVEKINLLYSNKELKKLLVTKAFEKVRTTFDRAIQLEKLYRILSES